MAAAYEVAVKRASFKAAADLSASQYCFVKIDSNGRAAICGVDDNAIGVLQDAPDAIDRVGAVGIVGSITKCRFGASVTVGTRVGSDSSGRAVAVGSGDIYALGTVLVDGAAADGVGVILFDPQGIS